MHRQQVQITEAMAPLRDLRASCVKGQAGLLRTDDNEVCVTEDSFQGIKFPG